MSRQIESIDPYPDKLLKIIPADIVAGYIAAKSALGFSQGSAEDSNVAASGFDPVSWMKWVFFIFLGLTPIYSKIIGRVKSAVQIALTTIGPQTVA